MKEQLAHFGQENNRDGAPKTIQSIQEIISSLKNIPPTNYNSSNNSSATNVPADQPSTPSPSSSSSSTPIATSRHEKRMSMSSLPSRSSSSHLTANSLNTLPTKDSPFSTNSTTTTLHISQPPRGTSIETALQSTVATLRRLSVSDSKRPIIPTSQKEDDPVSFIA
ncbi:hypothetical protein BGZ80_007776 [Entomortierella chlamydospora]|uniref:Uncharacterized protein n=1 Tax=Entomortierella chlamydospora TaxID=101097 RepID=A0A9P6MEJ1_9FUNG|nr:hypothetical protein BGZ80_007776 [Entomortierella chlamydospora]